MPILPFSGGYRALRRARQIGLPRAQGTAGQGTPEPRHGAPAGDPPPPRTPRESGRRPRGRAYSRRLIGRCSWCLLADPRWDFTTYSHKGKGRLAEARPYGWVLGAKELLLMLDQ